MNNEISRDLTSIIKPQVKHALPKKDMPISAQDNNASTESYEAAQQYLNALGRTKVNMDKTGVDSRIIESLNEFKKDPEFAQNYIDFCDSLQEEGYSLEDAIIGTDIIFDKLKDEKMYNP